MNEKRGVYSPMGLNGPTGPCGTPGSKGMCGHCKKSAGIDPIMGGCDCNDKEYKDLKNNIKKLIYGEPVVFKNTVNTHRNELCHCGSGKKYKKCHGLKNYSFEGQIINLISDVSGAKKNY
jgi:hypothetical protein